MFLNLKIGRNEGQFYWCFAICLLILFSSFNECNALSIEALKVPMGDLKKEVFSWMFAVKIAAVAVGGAFAVVKQSVVPFGVGAGITAGIHFFDKFIGDASGVLI